jgi:hypothetical protein
VEAFDSYDCYWIANRQNPTNYSYDPHSCDRLSITYQEEFGFKIEGGTQSGILGPAEGIELFKSMYKAEIEHLMDVYGDDSVEVHWGILNWAS